MYSYANRNKETSLRKQFIYIALIGLLPFLLIGILGYTDWVKITAIDYEIGNFFYNLREPFRTSVATGITRIADREGQTILTILIVLLLFLTKKWRTGLWYGITVLIGSDYLNSFVKEIFQRTRPDQIEHLVEQGGYAYPSGHSMGSLILFGGILFILFRLMNTKRWNNPVIKWVISIFLSLLILMIGLSRIYLGVHYPSDVIGGFSLGLTWLSLSIALFGLPITRKEFQQRNKYRINTR